MKKTGTWRVLQNLLLLPALLLFFPLAGCRSGLFSCPYLLEDLQLASCPAQGAAGPDEGAAAAEGLQLSFVFTNRTEREIAFFDIAGSVCSAESGEELFSFCRRLEEEVAAGESLSCSLDLPLWDAGEEELYGEGIYVRLIRYSDGRGWKDAFGRYAPAEF